MERIHWSFKKRSDKHCCSIIAIKGKSMGNVFWRCILYPLSACSSTSVNQQMLHLGIRSWIRTASEKLGSVLSLCYQSAWQSVYFMSYLKRLKKQTFLEAYFSFLKFSQVNDSRCDKYRSFIHLNLMILCFYLIFWRCYGKYSSIINSQKQCLGNNCLLIHLTSITSIWM